MWMRAVPILEPYPIRSARCWTFWGERISGMVLGKPEDADKLQWKVTLNKPLIVSEFGGSALYGRHGDKDERWTEEYQEKTCSCISWGWCSACRISRG